MWPNVCTLRLCNIGISNITSDTWKPPGELEFLLKNKDNSRCCSVIKEGIVAKNCLPDLEKCK